jgi:hypothetical protein
LNAIDVRHDAMLINPPVCEPREVTKDVFVIGVKDVRTVQVVKDSSLEIMLFPAVSADMISLFQDKDFFAGRGESFGDNSTGPA